MFSKLKQLTEAVSGKFIIALVDKSNKVLGYYVADDEELIDNPKNALVFNSADQAKKNAQMNNKQWDLERGQKFTVVDQQIAKVITEEELVNEGKEYPDSSHFDADADKIEEFLKNASKIVNSPEWADWVEQTDQNFGTRKGSAEDLSSELEDSIENALIAFKTFYTHMINVSEN